MNGTSVHPDGNITIEDRDGILLIGLNRPEKLNALTPRMMVQLSEAYAGFDREEKHRCAVLYGHGRAFCGGADLSELKAAIEADRLSYGDDGFDPFGLSGRRLSKPLVVAIHGACFAGGLEVALNGDILVAEKGTKLGQPEVLRGLFAFGGGAIRWVERCGWGNAQRYLLTGDAIDADEARRIGLVQEVVDPDQAIPCAVALAQKISSAAPLGVRSSLAVSRAAVESGPMKAASLLPQMRRMLIATADAAEGVRSFVEKRPPGPFAGR
jgi:enoyl-CoA hydratase/carnithine racemase